MSDHRSQEAQAYRKLYGTARWQRRRSSQLKAHPLCKLCLGKGHVIVATVCDHVIPHRGDERLFWDAGNLQSLCGPCHSSEKQQIELHGYSNEIGLDGWPVHPLHPANRGSRA
ncbi:HNH endonuclease [Mesorhizobium sp. WSM3873]|uniref:HNH endonuclease n=1 Tax=Mesorhizobium sp. WSM3873 TaxID=1854056 RepID=UPI0032AF54EA